MNAYEEYLTHKVPELLSDLTTDMKPTFGVMTPQHMVEHLIYTSKSTVKDYGPAPEEFTDSQQRFMRFVKKGAHFRYYHKDIRTEDLPAPRMSSLQEAIDMIPEAISRLYAYDRDHVFFNQMMGAFTFDEMELFHKKHYEHHLQRQFGLGL